jgi:hypothetical protein
MIHNALFVQCDRRVCLALSFGLLLLCSLCLLRWLIWRNGCGWRDAILCAVMKASRWEGKRFGILIGTTRLLKMCRFFFCFEDLLSLFLCLVLRWILLRVLDAFVLIRMGRYRKVDGLCLLGWLVYANGVCFALWGNVY